MLAFLMMGSVIVQTTEMTQGDFMVFVLLVYQLYQPIKRMARANAEIQQAVGVLPRIHEVFSWENSIPESPNPQRPKSFPHLSRIVFDQVGFSYLSGQPILNQISFEVQQGQTVALVGPSGGGKTTLLQLLPRFYDCTSGRILFDDLDQKRMAKADLRALFAMVTQDTVLFSDTVHNNIAYGQPELTRAAVEEAAVQANAHSFIQELPHGYDTVLGEGGSGLSGGQRQRIAIARAILKNAPVLILDEATSALDTESETEVQIALERLMGSKTAFVIAHRLSTVRKADLILVLEKGAIVERGTHQELLNRQGLYAKLHTLQQEPTTK
jgi:subfamily B ATP-binding cassette protein MsbA